MNDPNMPPQVRWAQLRFAVVGPLLVESPPDGQLYARLVELAEQDWPHPISGARVRFSARTIERWYYRARAQESPTTALQQSRRCDAGRPRALKESHLTWLRQSYADHPSWSYLLRYENLRAGSKPEEKAALPSYATMRRFLRREGLRPRRCVADRHATPGAARARARFQQREVRSFEHSHTHALWHIDGHHGSLPLSHHGEMQRPVLIAIVDDHSRLICHAQWFWHEDAQAAAQVLMQAIVKRGLPRMFLSDNGGAYTAAEITQGLHRLGVLTETTLCYSPYQNGKMEVFWGQLEGRLMAMLHRQALDLYRLNEVTLAWIEHEYHRRTHAGIQATPLSRYLASPHVGRVAPTGVALAQAFTRRETREQRRSDGSISLAGKRFSIPSRYRHLDRVAVRYASWDLDSVFLAHPDTEAILERLLPVDREGNASGARTEIDIPQGTTAALAAATTPALPPLLQEALDQSRGSGLPPAFVPFEHAPKSQVAIQPEPESGAGVAP